MAFLCVRALQVIADLETTEEMVAFTLSAYALTVGFCPLAWGPLSDRYGRRGVLLSCLLIFIVAAIIAGYTPALSLCVVCVSCVSCACLRVRASCEVFLSLCHFKFSAACVHIDRGANVAGHRSISSGYSRGRYSTPHPLLTFVLFSNTLHTSTSPTS